MNRPTGRIAGVAALLLLAATPPALADAPETLQARVANAAFLAQAPPPPTPGAVCVIDSGVDTDTDVAPAIVSRYANDGGAPDDVGALGDDGTTLTKHGTLVSGVIASQLDGLGSSGIWPRAKIISVRIFAGPSTGTTADHYINAMTRCRLQPDVKVINLSLAGLTMTQDEKDRLQNAITNTRDFYGINVVAAAGNQGLPTIPYPAQFTGVFAVGATNSSGARWTSSAAGSNYGADLDISTLGQGVCVTLPATVAPASLLGRADGTSFATPTVSAVLAAMRSYAPSITFEQAETALLASSTTTSAGKTLNAAAGFEYAATHYSAPQLAALVASYQPGSAFDCSAPLGADGSGTTTTTLVPSTRANETKPSTQAPTSAVTTPVDPTPARMTPAPMIVPTPPIERRSSARTPTPKLRSVSLRRGVLRVSISGYQRGMRATFRVDRKRYVRHASTLKLKVRTWETVRVQLAQRGHPVSRALVIRRSEEF